MGRHHAYAEADVSVSRKINSPINTFFGYFKAYSAYHLANTLWDSDDYNKSGQIYKLDLKVLWSIIIKYCGKSLVGKTGVFEVLF